MFRASMEGFGGKVQCSGNAKSGIRVFIRSGKGAIQFTVHSRKGVEEFHVNRFWYEDGEKQTLNVYQGTVEECGDFIAQLPANKAEE